MTKTKKIKFIKVETDRPLITFYPPKFEPEPRLYMELLENKSKVKPQLRNTDWISKTASGGMIPSIVSIQDEPRKPYSPPKGKKIIDITNATDNDIKEFEEKAAREREDSRRSSDRDRKDDLDGFSGSIKFGFKEKLKQKRTRESDRDYKRESDRDYKRESDRDYKRESDRDYKRESDRDYKRESDRDYKRESDRDYKRESDRDYKSESEKKEEDNPLSKMLKGEEPQKEASQTPVPQSSQNVAPQPYVPPSLAEISSGKVMVDSNGVRDLNYLTTNEKDEEERKKELLKKFNILKRKYQNAVIPNHSELTDINTLEKDYKSIYKQLEVDAKAQKYKKILLYSFLGLEILLLNYYSLEDIKGFYKFQSGSINQYESLLYELGEKNYIVDEKQWPVEIRLIGIIALNTAMFVGGKMAERKFGINILNLFKLESSSDSNSSLNNMNQQPHSNTMGVPQKSRMRAPEFDFEDIASKKTN